MKKVLFLGRFTPPVHGAALMNENYFNAIKEDKNFNIKRIRINYSQSLDEIGRVNLQKFFGFFIVFFSLFKELISFRPDTVYFELAPRGFAFYRDSIYVLLCKIFRRRIVFHFQAKGIVSLNNNILSRIYLRLIFNKTEAIILSELLYYDIKYFINKQRVYVVPNAIKDNLKEIEFRRILMRKKNKKVNLLFLSNMIESKGPLDVLEICAELKKRKINFVCNFAGAFSSEDFKRKFFSQLKELNLDKDCFYLGPVYGEKKFKILERSDYLIFPTYYPQEGLPLVILEALMYGIPCLSYDNAAVKGIVSKRELGFVAKQHDWISLVKELIRRISLKKENPVKIRQEFKNNYLLEKSVEKVKEILK